MSFPNLTLKKKVFLRFPYMCHEFLYICISSTARRDLVFLFYWILSNFRSLKTLI